MQETRHFWISGRVQGVFFRASTQQKAQQLSLTGWVRNLSDGRVEVMASGAPERLDRLQEWLGKGPELAQVAAVQVAMEPYHEYQAFQLL